MFANNEVGTIEPVEKIAEIAKNNNIIFHTDAVQAIGNVRIDVRKIGIDALSMSAHKFYGPKGIGALYVRDDVNFQRIQDGGHQERDKRAGTENVAEIVGMGKAIEMSYKNFDEHCNYLRDLRDYYIAKVEREIPNAKLNGDREKRIVAVNRLSQQKNIFMLLRAMKRVLDVFPEYVLEIYGKGEQREELEKYAKELNISDNVKFMGQKANVQTYIVNASVFVSSSDFEGMSNSMLEAMAIGLPVVCTDCPIGGASMVIKNNINGILTPVGDDRIFADEIIGLLKNPEKAKRLGKQASELREQLNVKKIAKEWEKLFED